MAQTCLPFLRSRPAAYESIAVMYGVATESPDRHRKPGLELFVLLRLPRFLFLAH